ncbi:MAG: WecB/TagA/CpsF family glycosyltransferase [Bacillota bacterium]|jgi:N-acetylglucosaminyldiphosphoundecaprenol N-acetyl-beta-D-mannosaminyltransferase
MSDKIEVLGSSVDALTMRSAVSRIAASIAERRTCQVVTANAEILYTAWRDPKLFLVLHDADLVTADGMGVVLASRLLGKPLPERVAGVDLVHELADYGQRASWRFYLLGARPQVVQAAATRLQQLYPGIVIAGYRDGYFTADQLPMVLHDIKQSKADILLVAMGAPKQDLWLHQHLAGSGVPVGIGVGGTFDILAGTAERAPLWMQRSSLEWLFRLWKQPGRFWRMLVLPKFIWAVLWQKWTR